MTKGKAAAANPQLTASPGELLAVWKAAKPVNNEQIEKQELEMQPDEAESCRVKLVISEADEELAERITAYLREKPMELAALLAGEAVPAGLAELLPAQPPVKPQPGPAGAAEAAQRAQDPRCACGESGCRRAAALREAAVSGWSTDPRLALTALGLAPEKLSRAVFGAWAAEGAPESGGALEEPPAAQSAGGSAAPRPAGAGPGIAEWLSAAAARGVLHEPGPGFAETRGLPAPAADPEGAAASVRSWLVALFPSVPAAPDGLDLIVRRTAQRAAGLHETAKRPGK